MAAQKLSTLGVVLIDAQIPGATSCARKGHKYNNIVRAKDRLANKIHAIGRCEVVFLRNVYYTAVAVDIILLQYRVWIGAEKNDSPMQIVWTHRCLLGSMLAMYVRLHPARPYAVGMVLVKLICWRLHPQILLFLFRWFDLGWLSEVCRSSAITLHYARVLAV